MSAIYIPSNQYITSFNFRLQFDLGDGTIKIDLFPPSEPSVIRDPSGISVDVSVTRPDRTMQTFTGMFTAANINSIQSIPLQKIQGTYMWGQYVVTATVIVAPNNARYTLAKTRNLCAPDSNNPYANEMTGSIMLTVDCDRGKLTASGFCGYAYMGQPPITEEYDMVRYYPPEAELLPQKNLSIIPFVVDAYIGINTVKGINYATYDFGDNVFVILRIVATANKNVRCGLDFEQIYCGMSNLLDTLGACNATPQDYVTGFGEVNALLWTVTVGINENKDVSDYIDRLEKLLGVQCRCAACAGDKVGPIMVVECPQVSGALAIIDATASTPGSTLAKIYEGYPNGNTVSTLVSHDTTVNANEGQTYFTGTMITGDVARIRGEINGNSYDAASTVQAGWTFIDLVQDLKAKILAAVPNPGTDYTVAIFSVSGVQCGIDCKSLIAGGVAMFSAVFNNPVNFTPWALRLSGAPLAGDIVKVDYNYDYNSANLTYTNLVKTSFHVDVDFTNASPPSAGERITFDTIFLLGSGPSYVTAKTRAQYTSVAGDDMSTMMAELVNALSIQPHFFSVGAALVGGSTWRVSFDTDLPLDSVVITLSHVIDGTLTYTAQAGDVLQDVIDYLYQNIAPAQYYLTDGIQIPGMTTASGTTTLTLMQGQAGQSNLKITYTADVPIDDVNIQYRPYCDPHTTGIWTDAGNFGTGQPKHVTIPIPDDKTYQVKITSIMADGSSCAPMIITAQGNCAQVVGINSPPAPPPQRTFIADWGWQDLIPFATTADVTAFTAYTRNATINSGGDIDADFSAAPQNTSYLIMRYPASENVKTIWYNSGLNNGQIPDIIFDSYSNSQYHYVFSKVQPAIGIGSQATIKFS